MVPLSLTRLLQLQKRCMPDMPLVGSAQVECPAGPCQAFAVFEVVVYDGTFQTFAVVLVWIGIGDVVAVGEVFVVPVTEGRPAWVAELVNYRLRTEVVFDEQLDCPQLVFP